MKSTNPLLAFKWFARIYIKLQKIKRKPNMINVTGVLFIGPPVLRFLIHYEIDRCCPKLIAI
ncbi:MAG: hypothetical protein ABIJ41_05000 [Candidatus Omnitrophota bacterium]